MRGNFLGVPERRMTPRADVVLPCVLRRRTGTAIDAETVDLGAGGMRISTPRPLATDEVLDFDLQLSGADHVDGRPVLRHEGHGPTRCASRSCSPARRAARAAARAHAAQPAALLPPDGVREAAR